MFLNLNNRTNDYDQYLFFSVFFFDNLQSYKICDDSANSSLISMNNYNFLFFFLCEQMSYKKCYVI